MKNPVSYLQPCQTSMMEIFADMALSIPLEFMVPAVI